MAAGGAAFYHGRDTLPGGFMLWDRHDLERYERWLASAQGGYAFAQECRLLEWLTAAWPRRGMSCRAASR